MCMNFLFKTLLRNRKPLQNLQLDATLLFTMRPLMGVLKQANSQGIYSDKLWGHLRQVHGYTSRAQSARH